MGISSSGTTRTFVMLLSSLVTWFYPGGSLLTLTLILFGEVSVDYLREWRDLFLSPSLSPSDLIFGGVITVPEELFVEYFSMVFFCESSYF